MKHKLCILLCAVVLLAGGLSANSSYVKAARDYTNTNLSITKVEDINVYNDYIINSIPIDTTYTQNQDGVQVYKITLNNDGFVSLLLAAGGVTKSVITSNAKGTTVTNPETKVFVTIYRDANLLYPVSVPVSATTSSTSTTTSKGESITKVALDQGVYYIAIYTDKYSFVPSTGITTFVKGTAVFVIYYQETVNNEIYRPSKVGTENQISVDSEFAGLLTTTNPKDYYKIELTDKALVKLNVMYGSKNSAKFVLYSTEREELVAKTILGNSVWYNIEKYLEPGTYYCSLETLTPFDGGETNILITQTVYPLKLTKMNENINSYITVETIDDPKEIRYVSGRLTNSELISTKWNNAKIITEELKFGVNKIGYYTVRVTDQYGNMFMQSIKVTTCDKNAPNKPTIKSYIAGSYIVSGTAEKKSTVTVLLNGNQIFTCIASSKGSYKCTLPNILVKGLMVEVYATDAAGNISAKTEVRVK
ncbi:MAG: Ig-like domain-containing protein [Mobilitalea sp.]